MSIPGKNIYTLPAARPSSYSEPEEHSVNIRRLGTNQVSP
jgi:hypothetical protein